MGESPIKNQAAWPTKPFISSGSSYVYFLYFTFVLLFLFFFNCIYLLFYTIVCHGGYSHPTGYIGFSICLHFICPFVEWRIFNNNNNNNTAQGTVGLEKVMGAELMTRSSPSRTGWLLQGEISTLPDGLNSRLSLPLL